jgi:hypothetical protein
MNAIMIIHPYKHRGDWVFDDEATGLVKEPFVAGADDMLDLVTNNGKECTLTFAGTDFPHSQYTLHKIGPGVGNGTIYDFEGEVDGANKFINMWLCPALFKYFDEAPNKIYFKVKLPL